MKTREGNILFTMCNQLLIYGPLRGHCPTYVDASCASLFQYLNGCFNIFISCLQNACLNPSFSISLLFPFLFLIKEPRKRLQLGRFLTCLEISGEKSYRCQEGINVQTLSSFQSNLVGEDDELRYTSGRRFQYKAAIISIMKQGDVLVREKKKNTVRGFGCNVQTRIFILISADYNINTNQMSISLFFHDLLQIHQGSY